MTNIFGRFVPYGFDQSLPGLALACTIIYLLFQFIAPIQFLGPGSNEFHWLFVPEVIIGSFVPVGFWTIFLMQGAPILGASIVALIVIVLLYGDSVALFIGVKHGWQKLLFNAISLLLLTAVVDISLNGGSWYKLVLAILSGGMFKISI